MELPITDITGRGSEGLEKGVAGILGMDFLSRFDVKLDFRTGAALKILRSCLVRAGYSQGGAEC